MELAIEQALQQGVAAHKEGKLQEAERVYRAILQSHPAHPDANHNLGVLVASVNKAYEALPLFKTALEANPKIEQFWMSYIETLIKENQFENAEQVIQQGKQQGVDEERLNSLETQLASIIETENVSNLSPSQARLNTLRKHYQNGQFSDAESSALSIIQEFPRHQFAWKVLGAVYGQTGRNSEAINANQTSVALSPEDAKAHNNLGATLQELGRCEEAEASYTKAIALKSDYPEAHSNLGATLEELGRLDEAEASYTQAIALKPDYSKAHYNLGKILYIKGNEDLALKSIVKANDIEPQSRDYELMLSVMEVRKSRRGNEASDGDTSIKSALTGLISSPLILNRVVDSELIASLYEMNSIQLAKTKRVGALASGDTDARYGNGIVSPDFNLFKDARSIIQKVAEDLTKIMMGALKSDIYIYDSFFNILRAGGGLTPHTHLRALDKNIALDLGKQKYSLVYYLSVGDQNCREPGILKLYEPDEDILPHEGMIAIFPASRVHSSYYGGKTDRVMIGVNFYSL